jgi:hypothetical protein
VNWVVGTIPDEITAFTQHLTQSSSSLHFQISNFKSEIVGRELLAAIARLGGLPAELGDQRPAPPKREIAAAI